MQRNLCLADRIIRAIAGVAAIVVGLLVVRGLLGVGLALIGALLVFSSSVGFCHVYKFLGLSTKRPENG